MRPRIIATLAAVAVTLALAACSSDNKGTQASGPGTTTAAGGTAGSDGSTAGGTSGTSAPAITLPPGVTFPNSLPGNLPALPPLTLPPGVTVPAGGTFPPGVTIPQSYVDAMIAQLEAAGMKVDHTCFNNLMKDAEMQRTILTASTPSSEIIQKLVACFTA